MKAGDSFFALRNFVRGKINRWELLESDPLIDKVYPNFQNPGLTVIFLTYKNSYDMLKDLNLDEDDASFFLQLFSSYSYEETFWDTYQCEQDMREGYNPWYDFDGENIDLLEKISRYIHPVKFDYDDYNFKGELYKKLILFNEKEMEKICSEWTYEKNRSLERNAREIVSKQLDDNLKKNDFEYVSLDTLKTTVGDLMSLYLRLGVPHLDIKNLIKIAFENTDRIGGWSEDRYQFEEDADFDREGFNREVNSILEKILYKIEEDLGEEQIRKYQKAYDRITSRYNFNTNYSIPSIPTKQFIIKSFDPKTLKLKIIILDGLTKREFTTTEENFYNFLYNQKLFNLEN